jgi:dUTP pyrophosphatase
MIYQGQAPTRAYHDDAGFDLAVEGDHWIGPHAFASIPLRTRLKAPTGCWLLLIGRSSTFKNRGLMLNPGVIDPGYTGPLFGVVRNLTDQAVTLTDGERICQAIPMLNVAQAVVPVEGEMPETPRGHNGFGSSGA